MLPLGLAEERGEWDANVAKLWHEGDRAEDV
jgi:hypothetical protein